MSIMGNTEKDVRVLLSILFPICAVVLLGYFAVRSQFIETSAIQFLGQFVMKVALPAFLLQALASKSLSEIWPLIF